MNDFLYIPSTHTDAIEIPDDAPNGFKTELRDLRALNEWKWGGVIVLFAPQPERLPLWGWLRRLGRKS